MAFLTAVVMQKFKSRVRKKLYHLIDQSGMCSCFNFTVRQRVHGKSVRIPIIKGFGFANLSMSETWMLGLLKCLLEHKKGAFLDVGVNIGQTLIKLKCIDQERRYIGFEPNPACVFYANELIRENCFPNCTLLPVALFSANDILELDLFDGTEMDSAASLIKGFRSSRKIYRTQYVAAVSFAWIAQTVAMPDIGIVKIDVEGAELEVIKSLEETLLNHRPLVVAEILPVYEAHNRQRKDRQDQIEKILYNLNYTMFRVVKTKNGAFDGLLELTTLGIHSDLSQCDYVFVPFELKSELAVALSTFFSRGSVEAGD